MTHDSRTQSHWRSLALASTAALFLSLAAPLALSAQIPETFENLQVLPKDIEQRQLIDTMRGFSMALGVRCTHCHVGPERGPLSEVDFVSDDRRAKQTARVMMAMVQAINQDHLAKVKAGEKSLEVSCQTCHRGVEQPRNLDDLLVATVASDGIDAAVTKYGELRERHYGGNAYDFGEFILLQVAEKLHEGGKSEDARQMIELNAEHFPESSMNEYAFGRLEAETGNPAKAKEHLQRALDYDPKNRAAKSLLERLEAPAEEEASTG